MKPPCVTPEEEAAIARILLEELERLRGPFLYRPATSAALAAIDSQLQVALAHAICDTLRDPLRVSIARARIYLACAFDPITGKVEAHVRDRARPHV